ncbi:MAG: helix-turn-helix domain-containing protein [Candidatus Sericytochromatia bacterium]|nr:helix-turn-helix domain-containing protein [Candidatus Tanganyikabacteria bacterium]
MGRPSKLTPEAAEIVATAIRAGASREAAAAQAGIARSTLYDWCKRGESGDEQFTWFSDTLKKAEADLEAKALAHILEAAGKSWQAAAWLLERRFPDRWGRRPPEDLAPLDPHEQGPVILPADSPEWREMAGYRDNHQEAPR